MQHVTALCLLTMVMACACMVLLHRAFNVERYLKEDNPFSRFGMLTTEGEDDVRKLKLSARIQLILLGVTTIIITLYSVCMYDVMYPHSVYLYDVIL